LSTAIKKKKLNAVLLLITGSVVLWLVISHVAHFSYPHYFYKANPDADTYVGTNVVSKWADFSFFTYLTLIIFGVWCVLCGFAEIFESVALARFLMRDDVTCFVFCNYLVTVVMYTVFELSTGNPTFGLYARTPRAFHSFGTNLLVHYVFFVVACVIFIKAEVRKANGLKSAILIAAFLLVYYTAVKLAGEFAYPIRWFPYVIFDAQSFGVLLKTENYALSVVLLIVTNVIIFCLYFLTYYALLGVKNRAKKII